LSPLSGEISDKLTPPTHSCPPRFTVLSAHHPLVIDEQAEFK